MPFRHPDEGGLFVRADVTTPVDEYLPCVKPEIDRQTGGVVWSPPRRQDDRAKGWTVAADRRLVDDGQNVPRDQRESADRERHHREEEDHVLCAILRPHVKVGVPLERDADDTRERVLRRLRQRCPLFGLLCPRWATARKLHCEQET